MNDSLLISVIVPVYKSEKYLKRCVDSILNQTYQNLEIILVDDGSPDNCPQICDKYAEKDSRIRVIHKPNGGLSDARNKGLDIANGNYIAFVDSDDYIATEMYAMMIEAMHGEDVDIVMCAGCPHRGIFYILHKKKIMVYGDIGCYTLGAVAPLNAMDLNVCMGASCSGLHGFNKAMGEAGESNSVGVIGDSTFMHSGMTGITDISYNMSNSTVIILDNSITGMTGHQQNPTTGKNLRGEPAGKVDLEALCRALGFNIVRVVDPYDLAAVETAVTEELAAKEPSIIISRRPCVMIKGTVHKPAIAINQDACKGCKACMQIGCPAISFKDKKAHIDPTLCIGCEVCKQMCRFDAIGM